MKNQALADICWNLLTYESPDTIVEALERQHTDFTAGLIGELSGLLEHYVNAIKLAKADQYVEARLELQDLLKALRH
jgi:hypothetical protein